MNLGDEEPKLRVSKAVSSLNKHKIGIPSCRPHRHRLPVLQAGRLKPPSPTTTTTSVNCILSNGQFHWLPRHRPDISLCGLQNIFGWDLIFACCLYDVPGAAQYHLITSGQHTRNGGRSCRPQIKLLLCCCAFRKWVTH